MPRRSEFRECAVVPGCFSPGGSAIVGRALVARLGKAVGERQPYNRGRRDERQRGFTLLEILIAIALIGLLVGVFVMGATNLMKDQPGRADEEFQKAIAAARKYAVENFCEVRITFDTQESAILLRALPAGGTALVQVGSFPLTESNASIEFLVAQKGGNTILLGGVVVETTTVPSVSVYADGTCSPFRVQFRFETGAETMDIDPWTCAPVLSAKATTP